MNEQHQTKATNELRSELETTRARVKDDVEALSRKLSPENLKEEGKHAVRQSAERVKETVTERSDQAIGAIRRDPVPAMLVGAGLTGVGWWIYSRRTRESRAYAHGEFEVERYPDFEDHPQHGRESRAKRVLERAQGSARATTDRAKQYASQARSGARSTLEHGRSYMAENPLAVGALAFAAGFGIAALVPRTRWENETIGPQRDRLLDAAKEQIAVATDIAREGAREVAATAQQEGRALADEAKESARAVADAGREAVDRGAERHGISTSGRTS